MPAAAVVAGTSILQAYSANRAAKEQAGAADRATAAQERATAQARADREPWRQAGMTALEQMQSGMDEFNRPFSMADFQADPGAKYRQDLGNENLTNTMASRGSLLSGAALKAASKFNQDFASQEYGNAYNRYTSNRDAKYNRLASLAGVGQVQANQNAASAINLGQNTSDNLLQQGNARASGYIGTGNALANGVNQFGDWYAKNQALNGATNSGGLSASNWFGG